MEKIKVLIADGHYMFLRGIESILLDDSSLEVVGKAQNGKEAYDLSIHHNPDIILLDANMPGTDGVQTLKLIKTEMPEVKVLILTGNEEESQLVEALKAGAKGYILKNLLPNELLTIIHMINRGESIFCGQKIGNVICSLSFEQIETQKDRKLTKKDILTKREKEILTQVMKGRTNREIAVTLVISENTVKNHLRNIMEKLQMNNRVQAATFALQEGWLTGV